jgi:tetratricopeptide (TPR) repeat protein
MLDVGLRRISNDPSLFISRGLLYAQLAQFDKAEADFRTAERIDSAQSISSYAIDIAELQRNDTGTALSDIRVQLKLHPRSPLLNYLLAKMLWSEGSTDVSAEALRSAQLAVRLKPDMVEARNLLANLYIASGQYNLAIEQCRIAMRDDPSDQSAVYHLIVALRHTPGDEAHNEIPALVKRLAELQQSSLQQETDRKRFSLVEQKPAPQP